MNKMLLAAALSVAAISAPALAVVNPGFETGDLSGWTAVGPAAAVTSYTQDFANGGPLTNWAPYSGQYFATLAAGLGTDVYSTLSQTFTLAANQTIKGAVGYQSNDYQFFFDDVYLTIGNTTLFAADNNTVGEFGNTGWQTWSFTAPTAGSYTLELGVRNTQDNILAPVALLDAGVVPEPQSWALMIAGFGLVGAAMRRRKVALAA